MLHQPRPGLPARHQHAVAPAGRHRRQRQGSHQADQTQPGNKPTLRTADRLGNADGRLALATFAISIVCGVRVGSWVHAVQPPSQRPLRSTLQVEYDLVGQTALT